jgi:hypothetical protein
MRLYRVDRLAFLRTDSRSYPYLLMAKSHVEKEGDNYRVGCGECALRSTVADMYSPEFRTLDGAAGNAYLNHWRFYVKARTRKEIWG